ncbi:F-box/FBD/LRR-repeat protein [Spatholobus suberectus]|nr:F-box/FBD/LRR-repeat protein [Spatholobus suberectus]
MTNKRRKGDGEDRISELSDDVLCRILWFLPSEEAIATCLLSTRWRFLWRMVPALDFECTKPRSHERVNKFLSQRRTQRITRFRLNLEPDPHRWGACANYINEWFYAAINDGKVEHFNFSSNAVIYIASSPLPTMFTCTTIVSLTLKVLSLSLAPSVCLPSLKTLHLDVGPCFSDFKILLYGSPALELFHLKQRWNARKELKIVRSTRHIRLFERRKICPDVTFHLVIQSDRDDDFIPDFLEDHLENVVKAKVYITVCSTCQFWYSFVDSQVFPALEQLRNVEFLSLADFRKEMSELSTLDLPQFQNLVQLQLYLNAARSVFMELPAKCPKLQVSEFVIMDDSYDINKKCPYHNSSIVPV